VERQKLVRKIRKTITQLSEEDISEKSKKKLQKEKDRLTDDLCYVMYFPKNQKYIALFAQNQESSVDTPEERVLEVMQEARLSARKQREADINQGRVDKVEHAIEVELGVAKPDQQADRVKSRSSTGELRRGEVEGHEEEQGEMSFNTKKNRSEGDTGEDTGRSKKKSKKSNPSTDIITSIQSAVAVDSETTRGEDVSADPFFIDAVEGVDAEVTSKPPQVKVAIGELHRQRNMKVTKRAVVENDGTLSKQEIRLLNWKLKVREKSKWNTSIA